MLRGQERLSNRNFVQSMLEANLGVAPATAGEQLPNSVIIKLGEADRELDRMDREVADWAEKFGEMEGKVEQLTLQVNKLIGENADVVKIKAGLEVENADLKEQIALAKGASPKKGANSSAKSGKSKVSKDGDVTPDDDEDSGTKDKTSATDGPGDPHDVTSTPKKAKSKFSQEHLASLSPKKLAKLVKKANAALAKAKAKTDDAPDEEPDQDPDDKKGKKAKMSNEDAAAKLGAKTGVKGSIQADMQELTHAEALQKQQSGGAGDAEKSDERKAWEAAWREHDTKMASMKSLIPGTPEHGKATRTYQNLVTGPKAKYFTRFPKPGEIPELD